MATFKDIDGKEWMVELNRSNIKVVRKTLEIDLLATDGSAYQKLRTDPILLVDTIWLLCEPQAKADSVTDEQFGARLVGDSIDHATKALIEAILAYSPPHIRGPLQDVIKEYDAALDMGIATALKKVKDPTNRENLKRKIEDEIDKNLNEFFNG